MERFSAASDEQLLAATPAQPEAFGAFYRRHERAVLRYAMARSRDADTAADLTAETFAAALVAARRFRPGAKPATAWLFGIARNVCHNAGRRGAVEARARQRLGLSTLELADDQRREIEALVEDLALDQALDSLPAEQAEAVRARFIEDADYGDIADQARTTPAAVRQRVSRGLSALRMLLREER